MTKVINVPQDIINEIQRKDVEMSSRRDIISFMLSHNLDVTTSRFEAYQKEYQKAYFDFETAKYDLEEKYVDTNLAANEKKQNWELKYRTNELIIYYTLE